MDTKSPLQIQAYEYLKDLILSGRLDPETLYSETRMSAEIGISRTPMREAIQCLSQDGYIDVIPSRGFRVRQLKQSDMLETIQVRCAIEGFCVHLVAGEAHTPKCQSLLSNMQKLLEKQEKALQGKKEETVLKHFMEYDHQFHMAMINYAQNREFQQTFQRLMYLIHLTTVSALSVPGRIQDTLKEHQEFFAALKQGKGEKAYHLLMEHLMAPLFMEIV